MKKHKIFLAIIYAIVIVAIWFIKFDPAFIKYDMVISIILTIWMLIIAYITLRNEKKHGRCSNHSIYWCDSRIFCSSWDYPNDLEAVHKCYCCVKANKKVIQRINEIKKLEL